MVGSIKTGTITHGHTSSEPCEAVARSIFFRLFEFFSKVTLFRHDGMINGQCETYVNHRGSKVGHGNATTERGLKERNIPMHTFNVCGVTVTIGKNPIRVLPLNDGTDGFRFETARGTKGLVRVTNKPDLDGPTLAQGDTMVKLAGDGIRCYIERKLPKRHLWDFAG